MSGSLFSVSHQVDQIIQCFRSFPSTFILIQIEAAGVPKYLGRLFLELGWEGVPSDPWWPWWLMSRSMSKKAIRVGKRIINHGDLSTRYGDYGEMGFLKHRILKRESNWLNTFFFKPVVQKIGGWCSNSEAPRICISRWCAERILCEIVAEACMAFSPHQLRLYWSEDEKPSKILCSA